MFNNKILSLTNPDRFSLPALENLPSPLKFISNQFRYISFPAVSLNSTEVHGHHVKSTFRSIWSNLVPNRQFELDLNLHFSYSRIRTIKKYSGNSTYAKICHWHELFTSAESEFFIEWKHLCCFGPSESRSKKISDQFGLHRFARYLLGLKVASLSISLCDSTEFQEFANDQIIHLVCRLTA